MEDLHSGNVSSLDSDEKKTWVKPSYEQLDIAVATQLNAGTGPDGGGLYSNLS